MPWGGLSRSRGYGGLRKGWGRGPAVRFRAVRRGVQTKKVTAQEGSGAQKLGGLSDVDVSYAVPRQLHTLAFTGSKWVAFADQETGWNLLSLLRNGAASQVPEGDECRYPAVFLYPSDQERREAHAENK